MFPDNTHDFAQVGVAEKMETLAHGAFVGPEMLGHGFVDDRDQPRVLRSLSVNTRPTTTGMRSVSK